MFLPYRIQAREISSLISNHPNLNFDKDYSHIQEIVGSHITAEMIEKGLVDGTNLQESWFPTDQKFHIFISHAHKDETLIKQFAAYLRNKFNTKVFIDSCYWGFCDRLLRQLDDRICYYEDTNGKGWYNYNRRNFTTSLIHTMLTNALLKMMHNTETIIFVDSENSLKYNKYKEGNNTPSAWIYQEIAYANCLEKRIPERWLNQIRFVNSMREGGQLRMFCESRLPELPDTQFDVDLSQFYNLTADFIKSISVSDPEGMMNILHLEYLKTNRILNEQRAAQKSFQSRIIINRNKL